MDNLPPTLTLNKVHLLRDCEKEVTPALERKWEKVVGGSGLAPPPPPLKHDRDFFIVPRHAMRGFAVRRPHLELQPVLLPAVLLELRVDLGDEDVLLQRHVRERGRRVDADERVADLSWES